MLVKKISFILFFAINELFLAQILLPAHYKTDTLKFGNHEKDLSHYVCELDFDGDGHNEIVTYEREISFSTIKIFRNDFSLFKSFTLPVRSGKVRILNKKIINKGETADLLFPYCTDTELNFLIITFQNAKLVKKKIFSIPYKKTLTSSFRYLTVPHRYFLIAININRPFNKYYRRIVGFSLKNYKFLWEIKTVDYAYKFFYSPKFPDRFFYGTLEYNNPHYFSHGTFYRKEKNTNKILIEKTFIPNPPPSPDPQASDYSTDFYSYIVSCSFQGKYLQRKKIGERFERFKNISVVNDTIGLVVSFHKKKKLYSLIKLKLTNFDFDTLMSFPSTNYSLRIIGNNFFIKSGTLIKLYQYEKDRLKLKREATILKPNEVIITIKKVNGYYFFFGDNIIVTDSSLSVMARLQNYGYWELLHSKALNCFIIKSNREIKFFRFREASFWERIPLDFWQTLLKGLSVLLTTVIILWVLTLYKSRKLIKSQNLELLRQQEMLEKATSQLIRSEKLALLGTIAASFAHQLNSPLGAVKNSAERLSEKVKDENLDLILRSVEYIKTMVGKFLLASRPTNENEDNCCFFEKTFENWFSLFSLEFTSQRIQIEKKFQCNEKKIQIKSSELFEVISNLMFNARDAILETSNAERIIRISTKEKEKHCEIIFADSGGGIPTEIAEKIFSPFVTSKKEGRGIGLGLWITKRIIDNANGKIFFENSEKGAIFKILIPQCTETKRSSA